MRQVTTSLRQLTLVLLLAASASSVATPVRVEMSLNVYRHEIGTGLGFAAAVNDPAFVPFATSLVLTFDADVREALEFDNGSVNIFYESGIRFETPLSALVPWTTASIPAARLDRDQSVYVSAPNDNVSLMAWQLFHDYFPGGLADYRHYSALYSNTTGTDPFLPATTAFGTMDLLAYLELLRTEQRALEYQEDAWIYDGAIGQNIARDKYYALATIDSITVVPVPAAAWLLASALGGLALLKKGARATRRGSAQVRH